MKQATEIVCRETRDFSVRYLFPWRGVSAYLNADNLRKGALAPGPHRVFQREILGSSQRYLKIRIARVDFPGHAPRHDAELEWIAPERIGRKGHHACSFRVQLHVRVFAMVVDGHAVQQGALGGIHAEIS